MTFIVSTVDADEIRRLGKRFRKLDLDGSGTLSVEEFMSLPELQQNPLVQRVIEIFDTDGNKEIDFKGLYMKHFKTFWWSSLFSSKKEVLLSVAFKFKVFKIIHYKITKLEILYNECIIGHSYRNSKVENLLVKEGPFWLYSIIFNWIKQTLEGKLQLNKIKRRMECGGWIELRICLNTEIVPINSLRGIACPHNVFMLLNTDSMLAFFIGEKQSLC